MEHLKGFKLFFLNSRTIFPGPHFGPDCLFAHSLGSGMRKQFQKWTIVISFCACFIFFPANKPSNHQTQNLKPESPNQERLKYISTQSVEGVSDFKSTQSHSSGCAPKVALHQKWTRTSGLEMWTWKVTIHVLT